MFHFGVNECNWIEDEKNRMLSITGKDEMKCYEYDTNKKSSAAPLFSLKNMHINAPFSIVITLFEIAIVMKVEQW